MGGASNTENGPGTDREVFTSLYQRYSDQLYRFCLRQTSDPTLAEEALATLFLEAWRRRREVDLASRPSAPWLFAVARNVLRNQRRSLRRQEAMVRSLEHSQSWHAEDPSEELERRQTAAALVLSLLRLPEKQRQVVTLCLLSGLSYEAAAGDLKIPVGTVRSRLSRARLTLSLAVRTTSSS